MKKIIYTEHAPAPIGPYSQAVEANGMLFVSGQIAIDPATGDLVKGDIETETRRVLDNLKAILAAKGLNFDHVVKSTVFISDMNDFARINAVYAEYFTGEQTPARETVQAAALPKFVNIEISVIAVISEQ